MPKYSIVVVDDERSDANKVVEQILKLKDIHKIGDFEDVKVFENGK